MAATGPRTGQQFGPYDIRGMVGRGGMGEVYEAFDRVKGRTVALKLLPQTLANDPSFRSRFEHEAAIAARLAAPHVIPIHDFGEIDGTYFIDMRLVRDGRNLQEVLRAHGPMSADRATGLVTQVASALDAAHRDGLVHRDVKPENILITADEFVYLVDFGIAHADGDQGLTQVGSAIGSLSYMAPERFDDAPDAPASDIYSLGCVFFQMLTGAPPFGSGTVGAMVRAHTLSQPPDLSNFDPRLGPGVGAVLRTALNKDPLRRQASAGQFAAQLRAALDGRITSAPDEPTRVVATSAISSPDVATGYYQGPPATAPEQARPKRRSGLFVGVGVLVGMLAVVGIVYGVSHSDGSTGQADASTSRTSPGSGTMPAYATVLPATAQRCPGEPNGERFATITGAQQGGSAYQVHCSFAEQVYSGYQVSRQGDDSATYSVVDKSYRDTKNPDGAPFTVSCAPSDGYIVCQWTEQGFSSPSQSREYILGAS